MTENGQPTVERAMAGDREAFGELVAKYQSIVYATTYHFVGRFDVAEDLAQDCFLEAYRSLSGLRDTAKFGAWLRTIARRVCSKWLSRRKAGPSALGDATVALADQAAHEDTVQAVQVAIHSLPAKYREAIVLRHMTELSYEEMGDVLGLSVNAVAVRLHRARQMLRPKLESLR